MAFDESLAARIRTALAHKKDIEEKKMFGGIGLLLNGNMLVGVWKNSLIVRLGPEGYEDALLEPGAIYQFRVWSWRMQHGAASRTYVSASEDLRGTFQFGNEP